MAVASRSAPARIWVVDDDPEQRRLLGTYLTDQGYDVRCLSSGEQLMARLAGQRPDLVVLDVMLPGDDGLTLLRRLRDGGDDLPVVMLTARGDGVDRIIGLEQGADDYLGKPFLPRELTARIEAVLRRRVALPAGTPLAEGQLVEFGDNRLDLAARSLERAGAPVVITSGAPARSRLRAARSRRLSPNSTSRPSATGVPAGRATRRRNTASIRAVSSRGRNGLPR